MLVNSRSSYPITNFSELNIRKTLTLFPMRAMKRKKSSHKYSRVIQFLQVLAKWIKRIPLNKLTLVNLKNRLLKIESLQEVNKTKRIHSKKKNKSPSLNLTKLQHVDYAGTVSLMSITLYFKSVNAEVVLSISI
jgi:hypothetical protein